MPPDSQEHFRNRWQQFIVKKNSVIVCNHEDRIFIRLCSWFSILPWWLESAPADREHCLTHHRTVITSRWMPAAKPAYPAPLSGKRSHPVFAAQLALLSPESKQNEEHIMTDIHLEHPMWRIRLLHQNIPIIYHHQSISNNSIRHFVGSCLGFLVDIQILFYVTCVFHHKLIVFLCMEFLKPENKTSRRII